MTIRDRRYSADNPYARKENQAWELAGLARQDDDTGAEVLYTAKAREYAALAREWEMWERTP